MNKNFYCRISLVLLTFFLITKDAHAFTVASEPEVSPLQTLETPVIEPHPYTQETTIYLFVYNPNSGASTELYRSTNSASGFQLIATVAPGTDQYVDEDLKPRTTYYYRARAVLNGQYSDYGYTAFTTESKWYRPDFTATLNEAGDTVTLKLTDHSYQEYVYEIMRNGEYLTFYELPDSGQTVTYVDDYVLANTTYHYTVNATLKNEGSPYYENVAEATVTTSGASTRCAHVGSIERERWDNIPGLEVSAIPTGTDPDKVITLTSFEAPTNEGSNYGARIRGYICVPATGNYTFWIASDDKSELWLSTDESPGNKRKIASVTGYTSPQIWTKYPTQKSALIPLTGGQRYYIEALHKEATGGDHLAVGWQLPNGTMERPIPGNRLIQFERANIMPKVAVTSPTEGQTFTAPANITFTATASDADDDFVVVDFWNGGTRIGQDVSSPYSYTWTNVPAGTYTIEARAWDRNSSVGTSDYVTFTVTAGNCEGAGTIQREFWQNITGTSVSSVPVNSPPTNYKSYAYFETEQYWGNNYGSRMRGYVCVPQTGNYTFWISSDDNSQLWLSTDESPVNKRLIASVTGATPFRNYDKYTSQKSASIALVAGQKYYIEALHKEGSGNDFISVGWQLPNGAMERPIPGNRLIPIGLIGDNKQPVIEITYPANNSSFIAPADILLKANASDRDGEVYKVQFEANSVVLGQDFNAPYEFQWNDVAAGTYSVIARVSDTNGASQIDQITITVGAASPCPDAGKIYREVWTGISGTSVSSIPVNTTPNRIIELSNFSTPSYYGNDYGSRIRGYLCVPVSGAFTFYIASDDDGELWLSTDDNPANKQKIAFVDGAVPPQAWTNRASQRSNPINLVGGQRYYIEALQKEANGNDHVSVAWRFQDGTFEGPIPGSRLIPYSDPSTSATAFTTEEVSAEEGSLLSVYPNPVASGNRLSISLPEGSAGEVQIDVISATGVSLQSERTTSGNQSVTLDLKPSIVPGIYLIKVFNNRKRWMNKIQVK
jgi:hypothetical protein